MARSDASDIGRFAAELGKIPGAFTSDVRALLSKTGLETTKGTRDRVSTHPSWKHLASTLGYDMKGFAVEVGYEDKGQGELAGIYEYGSSKRDPHPTLGPVTEEQAEIFYREAKKIAGRVL